ncbi:MAG: LysM peptidoglycan-binding domain-containing protein [Pikeienuella sp.]
MSKVVMSQAVLGGLAIGGVIIVAALTGQFDRKEKLVSTPVVAEARATTAVPEPVEEVVVEPVEPAAVVEAQVEPVEDVPAQTAEVVEEPPVEEVEAQVAAPETVEDTAEVVEEVVEAKPEPDLPEPEFDLVRVDTDGFGLAAGRAMPGEEVSIRVGGEVVASGRAGRDGAFAITFQTPTQSAAGDAALAVVAEAGGDTGNEEEEPRASDPIYIVNTANVGEEPPLVVQPTSNGVVLLQPPGLAEEIEVSLDAISYDDEGRVVFVGRATARTSVRLYLDNDLILTTTAADDSSWRGQADLPIEPGVYALRVDQIDRDGKVLARVETPFQREKIEQGDIGKNRLTVQKGNNLWKLAERLYGSGARYTVIFKANQDTIRDPDLIYPGQIFTIPDEKRAEIAQ